MITDSKADKVRFLLLLSNWIKRDYKAYMDSFRRKTASGRLTIDELSELAANYWDDLAQRVAGGEIPEI